MKKTVLMLNTSHNDIRLIFALKEMGFYIIATGNTSGLIGEKYVDRYIQQDYSSKEEMLKLAENFEVDAVCSCCNDLGVLTSAYIAEKLGLPGHDSYENAVTLHHKDRFKQFARIHRINTPLAECFSNRKKAIEWAFNAEYPLIVKPTDLSAGRGVSKINNRKDVLKVISNAFNNSRIKKIVIEPFIDGTQHACCTFIVNKKVTVCCSNNEYSFVNPYRVEIDTFPVDDFKIVKKNLIREAEKIASLLNLKDGILHMQYRLKQGKIYIIEVMRRVLGNLYGVPAEKLTGLNWDYWEARALCGLDCSSFPIVSDQKGFYAYKAIMGTRNGVVKKIVIPSFFERYIFDRCILRDSYVQVQDYKSESLGLLFFQFNSREEMNHILLDQYDKIYVEY
jgi:biotin carboxylase